MKAVAGLKMSYQVQQAINAGKSAVIRGFRSEDSDSALCSHLYTLVRGNRQHRRAFLISLLNLFDDSSVSSLFFGGVLVELLCVMLRFFFQCISKEYNIQYIYQTRFIVRRKQR